MCNDPLGVLAIPGSVFRGTLIGTSNDVIIKKAAEFGEAEVWMNERLSRAAPGAIAEYITAFKESSGSDEQGSSGLGLLPGAKLDAQKKGRKTEKNQKVGLRFRLPCGSSGLTVPQRCKPGCSTPCDRSPCQDKASRLLPGAVQKRQPDDLWLVWKYEGNDTLYNAMMRKVLLAPKLPTFPRPLWPGICTRQKD